MATIQPVPPGYPPQGPPSIQPVPPVYPGPPVNLPSRPEGGIGGGGGIIGGGGSAGECSGACGGLEVACCEAEGAVTKTEWQYVGSGGSYTACQSYNYVGAGCGSYEKETTTVYYGWKFRKCCIGVGGCLLIPLLIWLLLNIMDPEDPDTDPNVPDPPLVIVTTLAPTAAPPTYDCSKPGLWTLGKKDWCCKHYGRGCPTHPPPRPQPQPHPVPVPVPAPQPIVHTSLPYDCNADYLNCYHCLMARWSVSKRAWCCSHARRGCPTGAPPTHPAVPAVTSLPFDCNAGFSNWQAGWSDGKKAWCCDHLHRGCAPPPPPGPPATSACPPMDCSVAYNNWHKAWTSEKKQYCCTHEHKGCPGM